MEQQISELTDQMSRLHDEGIQLDTDLEENQSEKSVKYRDLKKREENMDSVSVFQIFISHKHVMFSIISTEGLEMFHGFLKLF